MTQICLSPAAILLVRYRRLVKKAYLGIGVYALMVGMATLLSGDMRMQGPSYGAARTIAESVGSSPSVLWGVTVALAGVTTLVPHRKVSLCGLYGVAAWSTLFALSFLLSVNEYPLAGVSGIFAHSFIAVVVMGIGVVRMVDRAV